MQKHDKINENIKLKTGSAGQVGESCDVTTLLEGAGTQKPSDLQIVEVAY
jgi:hypothetical protein